MSQNSAELSRKIDIDETEIIAVFERLHAKRLLLPEPNDPTLIRMAPPFSGIPTAFPVEANGQQYYANCVWDAFGIAAALHCDAVSHARDGHTGEPLTLEIKNSAPVPRPYVAHFADPSGCGPPCAAGGVVPPGTGVGGAEPGGAVVAAVRGWAGVEFP